MSQYAINDQNSMRKDWGLFLAGFVVILCGCAVIFWPGFTMEFLAIATGIGLVIAGIFSLISWGRTRDHVEGAGWTLANGICEIILGALCLFAPLFAASVLVFVLGCSVVAYAIFAIVASFNFRKVTQYWWIMLVNGILSLACGFIFMFSPASIVIFLGVFLIMQGATMCVYGIFPVSQN